MSESARDIYVYNNGTRDVHADPAVLWRAINAACQAAGTTWDGACSRWKELSEMPPGLDPANPADAGAVAAHRMGYLEYQGDLTGIVREAFRLSPIDDADGSGLTESEVMHVLSDFLGWREKKDVSTGNSPSSSGPTDGDRPDCSTGPTDPSPTTTSTA